jgi:hypothetical protein
MHTLNVGICARDFFLRYILIKKVQVFHLENEM